MRALRSALRPVLALAVALLLAGCATEPNAPHEISGATPRKAAVAGVPLIRQADYYCGPTALAMVMQWAGRDVSPEGLARLAFTPGARGSFKSDMLGAARRQGFLAVPVSGLDALLTEVAAGHPVIVFQNLGPRWAPVWHYAVVVGYDLSGDRVTLHSGQRDRLVMPLDAFLGTWRGGEFWAITLLPPGELPRTASERAVLDAASALERADRPAAAADAYRAGRARWPSNWLWSFGLGNALYALGDLAGAERAFRDAVRLDPVAPEPRNNLDEVRRAIAR